MSIPLSTNPGKLGLIEVFEDNTHFLVRIHPENRDRAKKIVGRQWDGDRKAWVYPKDPLTYEALVEEFQKDADSLNIRRPKTRRPAGIQPPLKEVDEDDFESHLLSLDDTGEAQGKIYGELEQIRGMLESLKDVALHQNHALEELRGTQENTTKVLTKYEPSIQQIAKAEPVEFLPELLDLSKQKEIELLEKALIMIACLTTNQQRSFCDWVSKHAPLDRPRDFVSETHEFLKEQLGKIIGDEDPGTDFYDLIQRAKREELLYSDRYDPIKPIPILNNLNTIRNRFHHSRGDFNQWEKWSRSILYLMNLALVWSKVVIEPEDSDE